MRAVMSGYALRANPTLYYLAMMNLVVFLVHRGLHRKERAARLKMQTAMYRPSLHRTRGALRVERLDAVSDLGLQGRVVDVCSKRSFSYRDRTVSLVRLYDSAMMKLVVFLVHRGLHRKERVARLTMQTAMHRSSLHRTRGAPRGERLDAVSDLGLQVRVVDVCSKRSSSHRDRTVSLARLAGSPH